MNVLLVQPRNSHPGGCSEHMKLLCFYTRTPVYDYSYRPFAVYLKRHKLSNTSVLVKLLEQFQNRYCIKGKFQNRNKD